MNKPNNYDNTQASGEFTPIELGGHHMIIKQVAEKQTSTGKQMIVVLYDFAKNDKQPDYMKNEFEKDTRADKKWPYAGTEYIVTVDKDNNCSKSFKTFISCFEKSNNVEAVWGDAFCNQFKGKRIGGVFGEVENEYNGKVSMRHQLRYFCSDGAVDGARIPAPQLLNGKSASAPSGTKTDNNGFVNIPEGIDEDLPF
jgi:hypothetical protein